MQANRRRGEIVATLNGNECKLCLTLGALAELEGALGVGDLVALGERFGTGRLSARDMMAVLRAGLRGGGTLSIDVENISADGGVGELARIVAELLAVTFLQNSAGEATTPNPT